jgi:phosphatidylethanolamine-binding protein (PEBP) family uncharacterized protein
MKIIGILALAATALFAQAPAQPKAPAKPGLTLTSSSFEDGGIIPNKFTQNDPKPVSPKLDWTNAPAGVVSYVLWMHDPDTSLQKKTDEVLHWLAFNIPGTAAGLPEGVPNEAKLADGTIQPKSLRGAYGYMGPHRRRFARRRPEGNRRPRSGEGRRRRPLPPVNRRDARCEPRLLSPHR